MTSSSESRPAVLVTGITGMLGHAIADRLAREGHKVVGMDRIAPRGVSYPVLTHDLPDPHRWHEVIARYGVTRVVHAGAVSGPMLLRGAPARIVDINLAGMTSLLEAARIHGIERIVWFSSIMAYGPRADGGAVGEDAPLQPVTVYGGTKAAGEAMLRAYHAEYGVDAVALRVASCYGPGRTTACLIRTLVEDGLDGRVTRVRAEAGTSRQHVYIDDVVDAIHAALFAPTLRQRAYNIGPGVAQSLEEIVAAVRAAVPGASAELVEEGMGWNTFPLGPLMVDAARRDLGFAPKTSLEDGAAKVRAWVEARRDGSIPS
jgi:UDP-glucose 4-epimerase